MSKAAEQKKAVHWSFWLGFGFFIAVVVGLISFSVYFFNEMSQDEKVPVTSIKVEGEMPYTQHADIEQALDAVNLSNFINLDVNHVQQVIAKLPWVYSVSVRKQWPNALNIYVVDQTPVALWNADFLINQYGQAFQADSARLTRKLPAFFGPEGSEQTALANYRNFNKLLAFSDLAIDELVLTERFSWQLTLNDGVSLNLGRENRIERIQRFVDVYPQIIEQKQENQNVDYVDLRYDTGLAVGYKTVLDKNKQRA
ncbi:cell division protein FtsQ/DivIB [Thalassotalea sp. LPB0316]|uniref:cell division protein FtsQ/DivIB n=1 Tax=Thalassotalea sp. LPB0316 TaxID=2769490 RepID=UPI0018666E37|nr:cell division protein FtsQ/DivIB [Thalassotalea sp. LPB0316]QOL25900.1 cell division protein FtsQ/DivIB [Thalassotalea sp. LPB0316]